MTERLYKPMMYVCPCRGLLIEVSDAQAFVDGQLLALAACGTALLLDLLLLNWT